MAYKYKMRLSYDGTCYSGWQIQPNSISIQGLIEEALFRLYKTPVRIIGAGRTDAGVHALDQCAHFCIPHQLDCRKTVFALNGLLPSDIRIKELTLAPESFHAQYSALSKEYHYHLWLDPVIDPFYRLYRHKCSHTNFSLALLKEGAAQFVGTHDFATFANTGGTVTHTVRTIQRLDCLPQNGGIRLEFEGNGFLYKMVRNIVGTLLEIALGKRPVSQIKELFAAKDRKMAGIAAPAKGLFLMKIEYPPMYRSEKILEKNGHV